MKKIQFNKKLNLNKETISKLTITEIENIKGGRKTNLVECDVITTQNCTGCLCETSIGPSCGKFC